MILLQILAVVAAVAGVILGALLVGCVGVDRLSAILRSPAERKRRFREIVPYLGGLVAVLLINKGLLQYSLKASRLVGWKATGQIYELEGEFVAWIQDLFPDAALLYFAGIYVFGYVVLLVFPLVAYFVADQLRHLKVLLTAYAINYGVGVICYTLFVAYGPRNMMPTAVAQPMYTQFPEVMYLTAMINYSSNVFPSLHTSMSLTAMVLALMSREEYPAWTPIATVLGISVMIATMHLGIHWLTDVIAGIVLGAVAVYAADRIVAWTEQRLVERRSGSNGRSVNWSD
ncbi:PAP2 superfamily protein [Natronoarchaeum philippinense]|uniref:PAP2 superfamily protein n=1 Tax=Natronoarchaeum philippinense TaxID=558529 RepID=A0A285NS16_NATPI|nr:phosphatase PAP2 family protein [Natronoarchaeum philippinense]SNZ12249.1 PAP2 superfamily protein [Natronoarchaeum philippinense]